MKKSESIQPKLNFDGESNLSENNNEKNNKPQTLIGEKRYESNENIDYSFTNRLSQKKHSSEDKIYNEIIMLARHI